MLLPALGKAKAKAQGISCLNNLRQMGLAWVLYVGDNQDRIPPNAANDSCSRTTEWVRGWLRFASDHPDNTNTVFLTESSLGPHLANLDVWRCPSDPSTTRGGNSRGLLRKRVRSASMNAFMDGSTLQYPNEPWVVFRKATDIPAPTQMWVLLDERLDSINNGFFVPPVKGVFTQDTAKYAWSDVPGSYHNGACGLNFADGHSEIHPWRDTRTKPPVKPGVEIARNFDNATPSPGNQDAYWLGIRSTVLKNQP